MRCRPTRRRSRKPSASSPTRRKRGEKLKGEAEFYAKKPMPKQLQQDISVNELEIKAQTEVAEAKRKEVAAINAKYDDDKRRFDDLRAQQDGDRAGLDRDALRLSPR